MAAKIDMIVKSKLVAATDLLIRTTELRRSVTHDPSVTSQQIGTQSLKNSHIMFLAQRSECRSTYLGTHPTEY